MKLLRRFRKVLVVEDDPSLRKVLVDRIARSGYRVVEAADGASVLSYVTSERPDGIVLDLMLPGKDGMTILESLRGPEMGSKVPVIILTNLLGRSQLRSDAEKLNAHYFDKASTPIEKVVATLEGLV